MYLASVCNPFSSHMITMSVPRMDYCLLEASPMSQTASLQINHHLENNLLQHANHVLPCSGDCPPSSMSSSTTTSSLARSRTLRSNSLKPLVSLNPQPTAPKPGPSNVTLFLANLRLLELDLRDDWPDITPLTFSTKDAQQNQKKRIQCVEWALYQLFALWDTEETQNVCIPQIGMRRSSLLTSRLPETPAFLSPTRTTAISQPSSCPLPMSRPSEENWNLGQGYRFEEDHA